MLAIKNILSYKDADFWEMGQTPCIAKPSMYKGTWGVQIRGTAVFFWKKNSLGIWWSAECIDREEILQNYLIQKLSWYSSFGWVY